jgi:hypothetical protein
MMKKILLLSLSGIIHVFYGLYALCFFSCTKQQSMTIEGIFGTVENLDCKEIAIEFSYQPYQISLLNDDLLFLTDRINSKLLSIYDLKTQTVLNSIFDVGQGPYELPPDYYINPVQKDSTISILGRSTGLYTEHRLSNLLQNNLNPIRQIQFEGASSKGLIGRLERVIKAKNKYICTGFYDSGLLGVYDENGKFQKTVDTYPQYISNIDDFERRYLLGQAEVAYNQNSNVLVVGSAFSGEICFYRFQDSTFNRIAYYNLDENSKFESRIKSEPINIRIFNDDILHVGNICTTDNFIYVLYFGAEMHKCRDEIVDYYIFKFTSEGKAVKCYKINKPLTGICVSNDDKTIYSITLSGNLDYVLAQIDID